MLTIKVFLLSLEDFLLKVINLKKNLLNIFKLLEADAELCISLIGPVSLEGQRVFHIECGNLMEKKKWIEGIAAVLEDYKKLSKHKN